jgi:hypothetical protein
LLLSVLYQRIEKLKTEKIILKRDLREIRFIDVSRLRTGSLMAVFCEHADDSSRVKFLLKDDFLPWDFSH